MNELNECGIKLATCSFNLNLVTLEPTFVMIPEHSKPKGGL